jgi:copper(I)-binding protein
MSRFLLALLLCATATSSLYAQSKPANVQVADLWIRPTVEGQMGTGGFMTLTAREDMQLTGVSTSLTQAAEIHEMRPSKADMNVMEMRPIKTLKLPKGQAIALKPGGYHLMFMDLKQVLKNGSTVPLTLHFKDAKGQVSKLEITAPVGKPAGKPAP